jgi:hypothetical protein
MHKVSFYAVNKLCRRYSGTKPEECVVRLEDNQYFRLASYCTDSKVLVLKGTALKQILSIGSSYINSRQVSEIKFQ